MGDDGSTVSALAGLRRHIAPKKSRHLSLKITDPAWASNLSESLDFGNMAAVEGKSGIDFWKNQCLSMANFMIKSRTIRGLCRTAAQLSVPLHQELAT
jgi:hypothetical protein